jgi:hypothetical protein
MATQVVRFVAGAVDIDKSRLSHATPGLVGRATLDGETGLRCPTSPGVGISCQVDVLVSPRDWP